MAVKGKMPPIACHRELGRELGLGSAIILVIANMIGTGIFTTSGYSIDALGDPRAMLLCWFLGGILALSGALCYGELGAMFPRAGGEYVYLREGYGPLLGFLSGWISLIVGFSAPIAAAAIAFSGYFTQALPDGLVSAMPFFEKGGILLPAGLGKTLLALGVIILFSMLHAYSLTAGSRAQNVLTLLKLTVIIIFVIAGLACGKGSITHFSPGAIPSTAFSASMAVSLIFISFAYSGWNAAAYLGAEIENPGRNIPLALIGGTSVVMVLYLLLNIVYIYALPLEEMRGVTEVGAKAAAFLFGPRIGQAFSLAITLCLLSVISAMIMAGPRVYYAMAGDGVFFKWFANTHSERKTPYRAIYLQAAIAIGMVLTATFDKLLLYIGFTLSLFSLLTVVGVMIFRYRRPEVVRPYRTLGYPIPPLLFIGGNLWIIIFCVKSNPLILLSGGGTISLGILAYLFFRRRNNG